MLCSHQQTHLFSSLVVGCDFVDSVGVMLFLIRLSVLYSHQYICDKEVVVLLKSNLASSLENNATALEFVKLIKKLILHFCLIHYYRPFISSSCLILDKFACNKFLSVLSVFQKLNCNIEAAESSSALRNIEN